MDLILGVPSELSCSICSEWLDLCGLIALDTAFCNTVKRNALLKTVFHSPLCVLTTAPSSKAAPLFIEWIVKRSIRVENVVIVREMDTSSLSSCLERFGSCVRNVTFVTYSTFAATAITQYCTKLASLTICDSLIDAAIISTLKSFPKLNEICFKKCHTTTEDDGTMMSADLSFTNNHVMPIDDMFGQGGDGALTLDLRHCTRLYLDEYPVSDHATFRVAVPLSNLCAIEFTSCFELSDDVVLDFVVSCPNIQHLSLLRCNELTDVSGVAIARNLTRLKSLNLTGSTYNDSWLFALAEHRADTFEAFYDTNPDYAAATGAGYNRLLRQCPKLHTLCFKFVPYVDLTLLGNISTLVVSEIIDAIQLDTFIRHCTALAQLRLGYLDRRCFLFDFNVLNAETLPHLRLFAMDCYINDRNEPDSLRKVRKNRPDLVIRHQDNTLLYDISTLSIA